ncbi:MAG: outer membrane beta-barrel protein [Desulfobacterales bacterium]|jgi:opacity protein-like surface antigen|nr:outer membrane beta-barrel protein [Desulfobacterales bacterium]
MKKLNSVFSVVVFVITISVFPFNMTSAQTGWYMGMFGGVTVSPEVSQGYDYYDYYYNDRYDIDVDETWVIGFKFGYTPPRLRFASFEFEYSYFNPDVDGTVWPFDSWDYVQIEGDTTFHNVMFNGIAKFPEGKIHPYLGVGIGFSYIDTSVSTSSIGRFDSNDDTVFAWQILGGVEIDLINNLSLDIGYRFFAAESDLDDDYYDYYYEYDRKDFDWETSIITFGFNYKF